MPRRRSPIWSRGVGVVAGTVLGLGLFVALAVCGPCGPIAPSVTAGRVPATTRAASGSAGAVWLPYYTADNRLLPTYGASVDVDATGGLHVAYAVYTGSEHRATYAY